MGGDDLGSDDEYLTGPLVSAAAVGDRTDGPSFDDGNNGISSGKKATGSVPRVEKRNRDDDATTGTEDKVTPTKKRKKLGRPVMGDLGEKVLQESVESKAEILSKFVGLEFKPQNIARTQKGQSDQIELSNIMDRLTSLISKKQLKATIQKKSPRAIVLCISARRAVAVLKDLAPLKLRVAKLFPKQGTIDDQARQLETTSFGVAVGTPHRINELIQRGSLSLDDTRLLCLDTFLNPKSFSVYTLPDTASETEKLLKEYVHPECMRRKDLAVGFL